MLALALSAGVAAGAIPAAAEGIDSGERGDRGDRPYVPSAWQGVYAGVHLGNADVGFDDGLVGGAQIGRNWQRGSVVYGLEGDISMSDVDDVDWMATARGRLGYLIHPSILLYATAGLGLVDFGFDDTESDFVYGLGVEGKLTQRTTVRLEYLEFADTEVDAVRVGLNFKLGGGWGGW